MMDREGQREKEGERETCSLQVWSWDDSWCPFHAHPRLPASGAFVMSPRWALTLTTPTGSSFLLEVRKLQQLFTGQTETRVHHQAWLLTQKWYDVVHLEHVSGLSKTLMQNQNRPSSLVVYEETQPESVSPMVPKRKNEMLTWETCLLNNNIFPDWYHCVGFRNINSTEEDIGAEDLLVMGDQITCDGK